MILAGTANGSGGNNDGVLLLSGTELRSSGNGDVNLVGIGGTGLNSAGVRSFASLVFSEAGAIQITGTSNGDNPTSNPISLFFGDTALIESLGEGDISLTGNQNVRTGALNTQGGITVTSTDGNVDTRRGLLTTSSDTSNGGDVILDAAINLTVGEIDTRSTQDSSSAISGSVTLEAGNQITLTESIDTSAPAGQGGAIALNQTTQLSQPTIDLITSGGTAGGTVTFNGPVNGSAPNQNTLQIDAGTGAVQFTQPVGNQVALGDLTVTSSATTTFSSTVNATSLFTDGGGTTALNSDVTTSGELGQRYNDDLALNNTLTLTADELDLGGTVTGNNQPLTLQPFTPGQTIILGGTANADSNALELSQTDLNPLGSDLETLTIGSGGSDNPISLAGDTTFRSPLLVRAESFNGNGFSLIGAENASLTLEAQNDIVSGNILNSGGAVNLNSAAGTIDTQAGVIDTRSLDGDGGSVNFNASGQILTGEINTSTRSGNSTSQGGAVTFTVRHSPHSGRQSGCFSHSRSGRFPNFQYSSPDRRVPDPVYSGFRRRGGNPVWQCY
ncbi:MAG: hypothetical protein HC825_00915 [Oscillatoriales cyanobacterium RM1_1_9]|nr:hypothetical protein [Oscillatoriales cyanobacterium RM1_1_9]